MKFKIEITDNKEEDEIVIRCGRVDDRVLKIEQFVKSLNTEVNIVFYKEDEEFYFSLDEILFFETEGEQIYAHTKDDDYRIKFRLYELEKSLPRNFVRSSKSSIINILKIYSLNRSLTSSSLVKFIDSHKHLYVSRHYINAIKQGLNERSYYER